MNTDTGEVYRGLTGEQITRMREEGQPVVEVSERVANAVDIGMHILNRRERRAQQFKKNANRANN